MGQLTNIRTCSSVIIKVLKLSGLRAGYIRRPEKTFAFLRQLLTSRTTKQSLSYNLQVRGRAFNHILLFLLVSPFHLFLSSFTSSKRLRPTFQKRSNLSENNSNVLLLIPSASDSNLTFSDLPPTFLTTAACLESARAKNQGKKTDF